ncbi:MAG: EAL domain-containing protein [Gammaproteobacteria bacterium]|nr:EAL domain-containing protein [Gammaproteobacteria bacterium]
MQQKNSDPNSQSTLVVEQHVEEVDALVEQKRHAEKVQNAMLEIASLSSQVKEISLFYEDLRQIVGRLMFANNMYIALLSNDKQFVSFDYFHDEEEDEDFDPTVWDPEPIEAFKSTLTGYTIRTGDALLADTEKLLALEKSNEIQLRGITPAHWMGIPLKLNNSTIGVMVIQTYDENKKYTETDKELLIFVSQQIAAVLNQKQYEKRLKEYSERLEQKVVQRTAMLQKINEDLEAQIHEREQAERLQAALFKISELTNTTRDINEFYVSVHNIINGIMPSKNFYICTYDNQAQTLSFPYLIDEYDSNVEDRLLDTSIDIDKCSPTEWVLRSGRPLLINKSNIDEWHKKHVFFGTAPETWLGVPLFHKNTVTGVLAVQSYIRGKSYSPLDEEVLMFVSQQVATAISRKVHADSLQKAHEELKQINDELEKRVGERTKELSITNETLQGMLDERNKMQKKLAFEAFHDSLTGLPNRALFTNRLEQILKQKERNKSVNFSVLFLDLDRFKVINDSLGHLMGDALLQEVAQRLEECIRPEDTVARLGGDEFCVLLRGINNPRDAAVTANRIIESISKPFQLNEQTVFTTTSIGVTVSNDNYKKPDDVLRDADAAMYHAKESGKARYALFDVEMHNAAMKRLKIENDLRHALDKNQIQVYYQPIIDLKTDKVIAFEALARWIHQDLGFIPPDEFIPIAEETGMIHSIGHFILNHSLGTLKLWQSEFKQAENISMSVNFSSKQIEHHDLIKDIDMALEENELDAHSLKVEITEGLLIENSSLAQKLLKQLSNRNIQVLLDDFGTGYSSLSYLHKFTLHTIKIDRSFIQTMDTSHDHEAIVKTVAFMCTQLNKSVVAEGVESLEHVKMLKDLGIHLGQGYHYSRPVPADEAKELILKYNQ